MMIALGALGGAQPVASAGPVPPALTGPPYTLRVLASDELADMEPVLAGAAKATGVTVRLTPTTSREGSAAVADGRAQAQHDAVWFATNHYLRIHPGALERTDASNRIMTSAVVLGLRPAIVERLGWRATGTGWAGIAAAAAARRFTFGMADPHASNTGVSALVGVATAVAGDGAALDPGAVRRSAAPLRGLFAAQSLKAHSTDTLVETFVRGRDSAVGGADGLIEYESVLLSLNASGRLREPLDIVYPTDGVATADYPLTLLAAASPEAKDAYRRLVAYLRSGLVQREIALRTKRRPVVVGVDPAARSLFELPFPNRRDVVDGLVNTYYGRLRRPARTVYVLDCSGSMAGPGLTAVRAALDRLATVAPGGGSAAQFQAREQATLLPFRQRPGPASTFQLPATDLEPVLRQIRGQAAGLIASGGTAIYDALAEAYRTVQRQAAKEPDRITTIVLLTDGKNTVGSDLAGFTAFHAGLPPSVAAVPVFPILFGSSDAAQMRAIVDITGGQLFDARTEPLEQVFARIRADQ